MKAALVKNIKLFLLVYFFLIGGLYFAQRAMIYFPSNDKPDISQANIPSLREINVNTEDDLSLYGWYLPPVIKTKPVLVFFHGNASNILWHSFRARPYVDLGYGVLLAEYRGYGGNPGKPSEQGLYSDARAFMDWLETQNGHTGVVLYAESLGTGVAVQMATEYEAVKAVVLEAPYTSFADLAKRTHWYVPVDLLLKDRFDSISKIQDIDVPLIVISGGNDTLIPTKYAWRLFDAAKEPKSIFIIDGAGHNDLGDFNVEKNIVPLLQDLERKK